jgi:hypothetical protein
MSVFLLGFQKMENGRGLCRFWEVTWGKRVVVSWEEFVLEFSKVHRFSSKHEQVSLRFAVASSKHRVKSS